MSALAHRSWAPLWPAPSHQSYVRDEGYACQLVGPRPGLLELHFRLWGVTPQGLGDMILDRAQPSVADPCQRQIVPADHHLMTSVHLWLSPPPRPLLYYWELTRLARLIDGNAAELLASRAIESDLQLFVVLSARQTATLFGDTVHYELAKSLMPSLATAERRLVSQCSNGPPRDCTLEKIVLARLLSRRRSRAGWRSVWRRAWPHPATVEQSTPDSWPWWRRRLMAPLPARWRQPGSPQTTPTADPAAFDSHGIGHEPDPQ